MVRAGVRPLKVFLCHASGDKPPVRDLYKRLTSEGVDAWLDKEKLLPGQDWRLEIPRAVHEADVVVVCLSNKSITKEGYVQKEIKFALDSAEEKPEGSIFLIPARLEDCSVPERLSRWQWVDLYEENGFIQLLRSLKLRADAVGATVEPSSYVDSDKETERRLDQLYTEGLAAFYTEDWDRACHRFQSILSEHPNHKNAAEKLAEAERQRNLARLYEQAADAVRAEDWDTAIKILEELSQKAAEYKDVAQLLKNARKQKQLKELYAEAGKLHAAQKWQAVVKVFEQIALIEPNFPDVNGLLPSAQKEVAEIRRIEELNSQYSHALREMDAGRWLEARRLLELVHKSEIGFLETEKLLKKVENEISKGEEKQKQNNEINTLYEQAHGLLRSKKWRNALEKMEEIQKLDSHFPDVDGISEAAQKGLAREDQEAERQNKLAAMYAEAVRLLKEEKYQEALDKWQEVKTVDPKYPDRQWVQRTAKRRLAETAKPVQLKPRLVITKLLWMGSAGIVVAGAIVAGVILSGGANRNKLPTSVSTPTRNAMINPTFTMLPFKTTTPNLTTATSSYDDPTMYDDFDNPAYNGSFNKSLWRIGGDSSNYTIYQKDGKLTIEVHDAKGVGFYVPEKDVITESTFFEMRAFLDPATTDIESHLYMNIIKDQDHTNCGVFGQGNNTQSIKCWSMYYGKDVEPNLGLNGISPGWHIYRFEIDPETMTISYIVDGKQVGEFVPNDSIPDHLADLKKVPFYFWIGLNNNGPSKAPVGYIDYVRMGAIEDDLVRQEPFVMAVGEWEATDINDKSYMTLLVKRVSRGEYTLKYYDQNASQCGGGPGAAEFAAHLIGSASISPMVFHCSFNPSIKTETQFGISYDVIIDMLVDGQRNFWHRIK